MGGWGYKNVAEPMKRVEAVSVEFRPHHARWTMGIYHSDLDMEKFPCLSCLPMVRKPTLCTMTGVRLAAVPGSGALDTGRVTVWRVHASAWTNPSLRVIDLVWMGARLALVAYCTRRRCIYWSENWTERFVCKANHRNSVCLSVSLAHARSLLKHETVLI